MNNNTKSTLKEIDNILPKRNKHQIIEARVNNIIASFHYLVDLINENFSQEEAEELQKRLYSAVKNNKPEKFNKKVKEIAKREG